MFWLWRLREVFDGQSIRGAELPIDNMVEGLVTQEPQTCDAYFSTELTDHLFQKNQYEIYAYYVPVIRIHNDLSLHILL